MKLLGIAEGLISNLLYVYVEVVTTLKLQAGQNFLDSNGRNSKLKLLMKQSRRGLNYDSKQHLSYSVSLPLLPAS